MFIHKQSSQVIHAELNDSLIHATLRTEHLLPVLMEAIRETPEYIQINQNLPSYIWDDDEAEFWESEECIYLINETLIDVLNSYAPDGYYFGAHEGNMSDFGYWEFNEDEF